LHSAVWEHGRATVPASKESAEEERELRTVDSFSVVETSILSNLRSFKQQKRIEPSGENGQRRHYDLLIAYRLQIGWVAKSLRAKPSCAHPNDRCLTVLPHRRVGDWSCPFGDCVSGIV
jgi:hypothetical protein